MLQLLCMRNAYALLGLSFIIVFVGAYLIFQKAHAPTEPRPPAAAPSVSPDGNP